MPLFSPTALQTPSLFLFLVLIEPVISQFYSSQNNCKILTRFYALKTVFLLVINFSLEVWSPNVLCQRFHPKLSWMSFICNNDMNEELRADGVINLLSLNTFFFTFLRILSPSVIILFNMLEHKPVKIEGL